MISNYVVKFGEHIYRVYPFTSEDKLELGNAYTFGGTWGETRLRMKYVLPFMGKYTKDSTEPGIYMDKKSQIQIIFPRTDKEKRTYGVDRIVSLTPETINKDLSQYMEDIDVKDLKYTGKVFRPEIKQTDDVGIKAVRLALIAKNIDFNSYSHKFEKSYDKANTRKALMNDSSLTFSKLKEYADIFDFEYGVIIFDKRDAKDPISEKGKAIVVFNNEIFPIDDEDIEVVTSVDDILKMIGERPSEE